MAKHESKHGGSSETCADLYQARYEGASVDWQYLRYVAQNLHQSEGEYTLVDHAVADEPFESTTVVISSRNAKFNAMAEILLEPSKEYENRTTDIIGNIDLLPSEMLIRFGLTKTTVGENFIVFSGASNEQLCLFVDSPNRIVIYNSLSYEGLEIEPPIIADTNCLDALEELTALWLISLREAEKTVDYKRGEPSELSFKIEPKKQVSKELVVANKPSDKKTEDEEQPKPKKPNKNIWLNEPKIMLQDIGGNSIAKKQLLDLADSFKNTEMFKKWGVKRPNGILLHGPAGNGKTMLVTAFANEIGANLATIQSTDFRDMWLGNSEKNLKKIFTIARETEKLSVLFFDEFDGIIQDSRRTDATRKSEAAIFKQEMVRLIQTNPNVIVMAATNDFEGINEALTRAGRFDVKIAIGPPSEQDRAEIFGIKIVAIMETLESPTFTPVENDIDVQALARATEGHSGADITTIVDSALYQKAIQESRNNVSKPLSQQDIMQAIHKYHR